MKYSCIIISVYDVFTLNPLDVYIRKDGYLSYCSCIKWMPYKCFSMFNNDIKSCFLIAGLTLDEITGNSILFLLVGYDTTASALTFVSYCLATNPDCQEKLIKEIDSVLGKVLPINSLFIVTLL